jgi:hypothetical protein
MNAVCTITAKNYYARAIALGDSLKKHNPDISFHILLADEGSDQFKVSEQKYPTIEFKAIGVPFWEEMAFQYDIVEFSTATKAFYIDYLFNKFGFESILYLDPDTYIYSDINEIFFLLKDAFIVLTPHITDIRKAAECFVPNKAFLSNGVYNLGFIGLSNKKESFEFLNWWKSRLKDQCYRDIGDSLFVDQKWMDLITCFFDKGIIILRDPGYNIAYWNIHERSIGKDDNGYVINEKYPLRIMHFSQTGIESTDLTVCSNHDCNNVTEFNCYFGLFQDYCRTLAEMGDSIFSMMPYKYKYFSNGEPIYDIHRRLFRTLKMKGCSFDTPFDSGGLFFKLLKKDGLIFHEETVPDVINKKVAFNRDKQAARLIRYLRLFKMVFGLNNYLKLKKAAGFIQREENQLWLIRDIETSIKDFNAR